MSVGLEMRSVSASFGALKAVDDVSIAVAAGSITGLIGPNGAGKSTLFNIAAGAVKPDAGQVLLGGADITALSPERRFRRGLLRTFQIAHEFSSMTALENLMMVPGGQDGEALWRVWTRPARVAAQEAEVRAKAREVIDFLGLAAVRHERAGNLSGGQKKLLELGRTMMVEAKIVLLDEVAAGVNRTLLKDLAAKIERLNQEFGYTFFMIEHDIELISRLCDPVIVMAAGQVMTKGAPAEIRADPAVIEAYFGGAPGPAASATEQR